MKKVTLLFTLLSITLISCTDNSIEAIEDTTKTGLQSNQTIVTIVNDPDFKLAFNKLLKDSPSTRKIQRIEFWLDTLVDSNTISSTEVEELHKRAAKELNRYAELKNQRLHLVDSLLQAAHAEGREITEEMIESFEAQANEAIGFDADMIRKDSLHSKYVATLAGTVQGERDARDRMLSRYPKLQDERYLAKCVQHYYESL